MVKGRKNIQNNNGATASPASIRTDFDHEFDCTFKSVSIAKEKASVGLTIQRNDIDVSQADSVFCGAQLTVLIEADPNARKGEPEGQQTICETTIAFEGIASCAGFSVRSEHINLSLQFQKSEVDLRQLGRFAALKGVVCCTRTGNASEADEDAAE